MRRKIPLAVCLSILGLQLVSAAEGDVPRFDINAACRLSGSVQTPARCLRDEQTAHDTLVKGWAQYKQSDASRCVRTVTTSGAVANYTELLICLQDAMTRTTDPFGPVPQLVK